MHLIYGLHSVQSNVYEVYEMQASRVKALYVHSHGQEFQDIGFIKMYYVTIHIVSCPNLDSMIIWT